jgi:hypothetical protein
MEVAGEEITMVVAAMDRKMVNKVAAMVALATRWRPPL